MPQLSRSIRMLLSSVLCVCMLPLVSCGEGPGLGLPLGSETGTDAGNLPPTFTVWPSLVAQENDPYSFQVAADDPDSDFLMFNLLSAPSGMTITSDGRVDWLPGTGSAGSYEVRLGVSDGKAVVTMDWTLIVTPEPPVLPVAPTITSAPLTGARAGMPYAYPIVTVGAPAPAVTVSGTPPWLSFDTATNTLSGTPPPPGGVTGFIRITAGNTAGSDVQEFRIEVAGEWGVAIVDSTGLGRVSGRYTSMALDQNGNAHIAYQYRSDFTSDMLKYATNASGNWEIQTADDTDWSCGWAASMALDASGHAHIAHGGFYGEYLLYTTNASGSWTSEIVAQPAGLAMWNTFFCALALDSAEKLHIVYKHGLSLMYTTNASGVWTIKEIAGGDDGVWPQIVLDTQKAAHVVSYAYNDDRQLRYATNAGGDWVSETLDQHPGSTVYGYYKRPSITLDASEKIHIAYTSVHPGYSREDLYYVTNTSGVWTFEQVPEPNGAAFEPAIAVDGNGCIHIVHGGSISNCVVRYVTNRSGVWMAESLYDSNVHGDILYPIGFDLALDSAGGLHVSISGNLGHGSNWLRYLTKN